MQVKRLHPNAKLPTRNHPSDAGLDLYAVYDQDFTAGVHKIGTGIAIEIPDGYVGLIMDRSGMGAKGFKVYGGVIDSTYRGEIIVCLGKSTDFSIDAGDKIAQLVIVPILLPELIEVEQLSSTDRGEKGFGSSGG